MPCALIELIIPAGRAGWKENMAPPAKVARRAARMKKMESVASGFNAITQKIGDALHMTSPANVGSGIKHLLHLGGEGGDASGGLHARRRRPPRMVQIIGVSDSSWDSFRIWDSA